MIEQKTGAARFSLVKELCMSRWLKRLSHMSEPHTDIVTTIRSADIILLICVILHSTQCTVDVGKCRKQNHFARYC